MATYTYIGGPCARRTVSYSPALASGAVVGCGGASYQFNAGNPGVLIWLDTGAGGGGGGFTAADNKQVGRAWHKLTHVFAVEAPHSIRRARAARARLKRLVR